MEQENKDKKIVKPVCPVCSAVRENPEDDRCAHCGADLTSVKSFESFAESLLYEARNDIRARKYSDAKIKLEIAASLDERTQMASRFIRAEIDVQNNNYEKALSEYMEISGSGFNAKEWGADLEMLISDLEDKIDIENAAREHYNLALHRSREGFFAEAREELFKASDLAPYLPEIYLLAAKVDLALGAQSAVYDDLTRYRQLKPDDPRGVNMQKELERRRLDHRIHTDQIIFAVCFIAFSIAVLIVIAFIK